MTALESAQSHIHSAFREFGGSLAVLTSFQREGLVILDLALQVSRHIPVLTIDTGRLPAETFEILEAVESRYGIRVERILPDASEVAGMVAAHGLDLFRDGVPQRMLCCNIRKVRSLERRIRGTAAYFIGVRRGQNLERAEVEVFDRGADPVKISPLADWTSADVLDYTRQHRLPEHPLYRAGYTSIGCGPCTRAVRAGEDERSGRWWWERDAAKECGLHFSPDGRVERTVDVLVREVVRGAGTA
jgi:phosphoadenylyl-sulfate reductase (thioredoxin)